jgi:multidrug efflux pump subunit AcrA (membrane-fusion protein)
MSAALFLGCLVIGCRNQNSSEPSAKSGSLEELPRVSTGFPVRKTFAQKTEQPGQIEAFAVAPIHAKVSGYVNRLPSTSAWQGPRSGRPGGAPIGQISPRLDAPESRRYAAALERPPQSRWKKRSWPFVVEAAAESAIASPGSTGSERKRLLPEADLRSAEVMADYLTLRAPFTGLISTRDVDPGRLIQSAKGPSEPPLFTVIQADTVRLYIEVPEAEAVLVEPGRKATIRVTASSGKTFTGTVARTSWTLAHRIELAGGDRYSNADGSLRPGMFARVELVVAERENALVV